MLSINTNLSSLITQRSMKSATNLLNQAVERMSTGYKVNHAKDNAANYAISTHMSTQLSAYDIAADNVAMGMNLVTTATDTISLMQDYASRLHALSTQARNGTYGTQSIDAINSEVGAIMAEITRLYSTSEYNGISLFNRTAYTIASHLPQAGESGFIDETALVAVASGVASTAGIAAGEVVGTTTEAPKAKSEYNNFIGNPVHYSQSQIDSMIKLTDAVTTVTNGGKYSISNEFELENLRELVESGVDTTGAIFVLAEDIDLSAYGEWTPIGDQTYYFKGTFDGNGHTIKGLTIDEDEPYKGLFGIVQNATITGVGLLNVRIDATQSYVGAIVGGADNSQVVNCYATGSVSALDSVGGLIGRFYGGTIAKCYANVDVTGIDGYTGGLVGVSDGTVTQSYATGNVDFLDSGSGGGLIGGNLGTITNCFATGNINNTRGGRTGGLVGYNEGTITNCFATGMVTGKSTVGGLVGHTTAAVTNCYATGTVSGIEAVGGLVGDVAASSGTISNSYATGNVISTYGYTGGLVGIGRGEISNCYATGAVSSTDCVGGLVGATSGDILNCYATGTVNGAGYVGGLIGKPSGTITDCYATGNVTGTAEYVGGLAGSGAVTNSYATGSVSGGAGYVGGLTGQGAVTNSYAIGNVTGAECVGGVTGDGTVINSYATGDIRGTARVGGLAGIGDATNSYATGNVNGYSAVGGLVGQATNVISNSYATGAVSATTNCAGGLVGASYYQINNSYATGNVRGVDAVGGLAGFVADTVNNSYTTGNVSGTTMVGGLAGIVVDTVNNSYTTGNVSGTTMVGGLVGTTQGSISNSYTTGNVDGSSEVGGLVGASNLTANTSIQDSVSYSSSINGTTYVGNLVGQLNNTGSYSLSLNNCSSVNAVSTAVGAYTNSGTLDPSYDLSVYNSQVSAVKMKSLLTSLQVGINSNDSSRLDFDMTFKLDISGISKGIETEEALNAINDFMKLLDEKSIAFGAIENRLNSALDSIEVNIENLTSSRSTIRDADIAEVSSQYIQQQILQQASATLMATANQMPSIALQLI